MNKVFILGNVGSTPEIKLTSSGRTICNMNLTSSEKWSNHQGVEQERVEWHKVAVFGKLGEMCGQKLEKGSKVLVEGRIQTRSWNDSSGDRKQVTEIICQHIQFLCGKYQGRHSGF